MSTEESRIANRKILENHARKIGVICTIFGFGFAYYVLISPLMEARGGASEVTISGKGGVVGLMLGVIGICYLVGGRRAAKIMAPLPGESKTAAHIAFTIVTVSGMILFIWVDLALRKLGYR